MMTTLSQGYRADIDGLRAIAVLAVVLFHIGIPGLDGGFVGVDVFFAISGYLISRLLLNELHVTETVNLPAFFARRIRRLLPALLLVIACTLALSTLLLFPEELPRLGKSAMAVPLLVANHHFMKLSGGYFDPSVDLMPLLHTWSLSVEEQFYLFWPLLFLLLARAGTATELPRRLWAGIAVLGLLSFGVCLHLTMQEPQSAYFLMPTRAWEFAVGALFGLLPGIHYRWLNRSLAGFLGGVLLLGSILLINEQQAFPGWRAMLPVLGVSLLMWSGDTRPQSVLSRVLGTAPLCWIGRHSYSWYLWHWPLLAFGRAYRLGARDFWLDLLLGGVLSLLLAILTYRFVEQPVRQRRPWLFASTRGSLCLGLGLSLSGVGLAAATVEYGKWAQSHQPAIQLPGGYQGDPLRPCPAFLHKGSLAPVALCTVGPAQLTPRLLLWGDSHADHYSPLFDHFGHGQQVATLRRERGSCPPIADVYTVKKGQIQTECAEHSSLVSASLPGLAENGLKGVVLSARWGFYLGRQPLDPGTFDAIAMLASQQTRFEALRVGQAPLDEAGSLLTMERALDKQLSVIGRLGLRTLIIAPSPELPFTVPGCVRRRGADACVYPLKAVQQRRQAVLAVLSRVVARHSQVRLVDPLPLLCDAQLCRSQQNGYLQYSDSAHLTSLAVVAMQPAWLASLRWVAAID